MKKEWSLIIILILIFSLFYFFVTSASADSDCQPSDPICFQNETVSKQIGSYTMVDSNGRYLNSNQWKNAIDLLFNGEGCIYPIPDTQTTFYADWSRGWYWEAKVDLFGDVCYKLKK